MNHHNAEFSRELRSISAVFCSDETDKDRQFWGNEPDVFIGLHLPHNVIAYVKAI